MATSGIGGVSGSTAGSQLDTQQAFRQADFLKIMLSELANQSPLDPQDTGTLVENMRKLQDLANSTYTKFRADVGWGQQLMGKSVNVQQMSIDTKEEQALKNKGVVPDVGFGSVNGVVDSFRVIGETVYVTVGGKDYPVDNIKQVLPDQQQAGGGEGLSAATATVLGKKIDFHREKLTDIGTGVVSGVGYDSKGKVTLKINGEYVPYERVIAIGMP